VPEQKPTMPAGVAAAVADVLDVAVLAAPVQREFSALETSCSAISLRLGSVSRWRWSAWRVPGWVLERVGVPAGPGPYACTSQSE
jgi:hypothetical protein